MVIKYSLKDTMKKKFIISRILKNLLYNILYKKSWKNSSFKSNEIFHIIINNVKSAH